MPIEAKQNPLDGCERRVCTDSSVHASDLTRHPQSLVQRHSWQPGSAKGVCVSITERLCGFWLSFLQGTAPPSSAWRNRRDRSSPRLWRRTWVPTRHRPLHVDKLLAVVEPVAMQAFLEGHGVPTDMALLICANGDLFAEYFAELDTLAPQLEAYTDLERINDLCEANLTFIIKEYGRARIPFNPDHQPERLALHLYLEHRAAFEAAWSNYALFGTSARLASFRLPPNLVLREESFDTLATSIQSHFAAQAKGKACRVQHSRNDTAWSSAWTTVSTARRCPIGRTATNWASSNSPGQSRTSSSTRARPGCPRPSPPPQGPRHLSRTVCSGCGRRREPRAPPPASSRSTRSHRSRRARSASRATVLRILAVKLRYVKMKLTGAQPSPSRSERKTSPTRSMPTCPTSPSRRGDPGGALPIPYLAQRRKGHVGHGYHQAPGALGPSPCSLHGAHRAVSGAAGGASPVIGWAMRQIVQDPDATYCGREMRHYFSDQDFRAAQNEGLLCLVSSEPPPSLFHADLGRVLCVENRDGEIIGYDDEDPDFDPILLRPGRVGTGPGCTRSPSRSALLTPATSAARRNGSESGLCSWAARPSTRRTCQSSRPAPDRPTPRWAAPGAPRASSCRHGTELW